MTLLLKNIDQMQAAGLPLDESTEFEVLEPHIKESQRDYLNPVLGKDFYDDILTNLALASPDARWTDLEPFLQVPLAFNAYYRFYKIPGGQLSHRGFMRDAVTHSEHAPKWEIDQLKDTLICKADYGLDNLIKYLTENAETYPEWKDSDYFAKNANLVIPTASIFNTYINIGCSGRVFQKLLFERQRAERSVKRVICEPLFKRLREELEDPENISPEIVDLIDYLRPMVAYETMASGILMLHFHYTDQGIYLYSYSDGTLSKTAISPTEARNLANDWRNKYEEARIEVIEFLNNNLADYPEYRDSPCYSAKPRTLISRYDNAKSNKHFGI